MVQYLFEKSGLVSKRGERPRQAELPLERPMEKDRNYHQGGRSFYFFDFDDNIAFLGTPCYLFHRETGDELIISSGDFARWQKAIGVDGPWKDFEIRLDDQKGTFRHFRDQQISYLESLLFGRQQLFIQDIAAALGYPDLEWKGPSWDCFYHAVHNNRLTSLITARGHHPLTLRAGIREFVKEGFLPREPNYLEILPVNHPETRARLGDPEGRLRTSELKRLAIRKSVERALHLYGYSPYHRFGMSEDDPENLELILGELRFLKNRYPEISFFLIEACEGRLQKKEVD